MQIYIKCFGLVAIHIGFVYALFNNGLSAIAFVLIYVACALSDISINNRNWGNP